MLDQETKRRIDSSRQILVGRIPNPQTQVEQITTALIYKFMDDMDQENIAVGGEAEFFSGKFKKYRWPNLISKKLSGEERLELYMRAIDDLPNNRELPDLFKDVFRGAFLPYRDAETLHLFLKEIDGFKYDHSENLGNAFEYLLSILGSQGDAGQFRTPRHIIDFIVEVVDPQKDDSVLDPACGTAGFLISAYKHIIKKNSLNYDPKKDTHSFAREESDAMGIQIQSNGKYKGGKITPAERKKMQKNIMGYDISPDMVKLSLVNMYLHKFKQPQIFPYDTLTHETRWGDEFDVILANPPFMSPKGGIRPHNKFSVKSNRSEVLFVDYIAEHLSSKGRAGIIVPEGIIFKSDKAYKSLRKMLVEENYLWAVASLPSGVFQPYSGVKTSILFLDKKRAKTAKEILFVDVQSDGFELGATRRKTERNDLPEAFRVLVENRDGKRKQKLNSTIAHWVDKKKIVAQGSWDLSGNRYKEVVARPTKWPMVELGEVLNYEQPTNYIVKSTNYKDEYPTPVLTAGKSFILGHTNEKDGVFPFEKLPVIIFDDFTTATKFVNFSFKVKSSAMKILLSDKKRAHPFFIYLLMQKIKFDSSKHKRYWISQYSKMPIPLPPLSIQKEIVAEIEGYQRIIDGAKQVVESWKPAIKIDPKWEMVELGEVCEIARGGSPRPIQKYITKNKDGINWIKIGDIAEGEKYITNTRQKIRKEGVSKTRLVKNGDFVLLNSMSFGRPYILKIDGAIHDGWLLVRIKNKKIVFYDFLYEILKSNSVQKQYQKLAIGGVVKNLNSNLVKGVQFPLPPLSIQKEIVAEIEKEKEHVESCKWLIEKNESKIKKKIDEIWGE